MKLWKLILLAPLLVSLACNAPGAPIGHASTGARLSPQGGTITGVTAGSGLSGGGTSGNVTLAVNLTVSLYGNGADGDLTCFDGTTTCGGIAPVADVYTLPRWYYPHNLTCTSPAVIRMGGYGMIGTGTLTDNCTIDDDGAAASNNVAGGLRSSGWYPTTTAGATHTASSLTQASMPPAPFVTSAGVASGGGVGSNGTNGAACQGGGGGGASATNSGGNGGAITVVSTANGAPMWPLGWTYFRYGPNFGGSFTYGSGGGGGADNSTATGGAGGATGGIVYLAFPTITGTGTISANGGAGGNASNTAGGGGGGGGPGGFVVLTANTYSGTLTVSSTGALGGTGTGGGGNGGKGGDCVVICQNLSNDNTKAAGCP